MRDHRRLKAFQLADSLVLEVYKAMHDFPREDQYGITSQIRRAAVSVPTNIVERCARDGQREYRQFLNIAFGSVRELGYLIDLSQRLGFLPRTAPSILKRFKPRLRKTYRASFDHSFSKFNASHTSRLKTQASGLKPIPTFRSTARTSMRRHGGRGWPRGGTARRQMDV